MSPYDHPEGRRAHRYWRELNALQPGIVLVGVTVAAAYGLRQVPGLTGFSPMITAIFIGMVFSNLTVIHPNVAPGLALCGKKMLRLAVALLGFQLTLWQVASVGVSGMASLAALVSATYLFTILAGRLLGVDASLTRLLAAGTSICGASAVAAANSLERSKDEDVSYAVAAVTLFGTVAMLLFPVIGAAIDLDSSRYGFWIGSSVHEVAQVVAAGFQHGDAAGEFSVVVKLSRVLLLAPVLIGASMLLHRRTSEAIGGTGVAMLFPLFLVGFMAAVLLNSAGVVPERLRETIVQLTPVLLTAALGALGLGTRFSALKAHGARPLLLAAAASMTIATGGLMLANILD